MRSIALKGLPFLCLYLLLSVSAVAQQREKLENQRKKLIQEIKVTTDLLSQTKKTKEATLERFLTLQKQIEKRQELIATLREEIDIELEWFHVSNGCP